MLGLSFLVVLMKLLPEGSPLAKTIQETIGNLEHGYYVSTDSPVCEPK